MRAPRWPAGAAAVAGCAAAAGAGVMPARCIAAAASATLGTWIVEPSTTLAVSGRPLYAATARVVKLLAAAIVHSVSPGATTCGTAAPAGAAAISVQVRASVIARRIETDM